MKVIKNFSDLKAFIFDAKTKNQIIGFAPTMGALHLGHLSLYGEANKICDVVIASIFVNPTQFNSKNDLDKYPRTVEKDIKILEQAATVDLVYIPDETEIYGEKSFVKTYDLEGLDKEMEGEFRQGHFDGVATVVEILLTQVQPNHAFFGEKDFQQLVIIKKLVEKIKLPLQIHGVPIYREKNGLAMSSRNERLTIKERNSAKIIYETLEKVARWFRVISIPEIKNRVNEIFKEQDNMTLEYFKIADEENLKETDFFYKDKNYRAFMVVFVNDVRLIDNIKLP